MEENFMKRTISIKNILNIIFISIAITVAFVCMVFVFKSVDRTPAVDGDYLPLEQQISMVEQNSQSLLKNEGKYTVEGEKLVAVFSNRECQITAEYQIDELGNLKLISTKKEDKSWSTFKALGFALLSGIMVGCIVMMPYTLTAAIVEEIIDTKKSKKANSRK